MNRIAICSIIIEDKKNIETLNTLLSEYAPYIIGRMGLPYQKYNISIISIALDAPQDIINALSGKIGRIEGVSAKTLYSRQIFEAK